MVTRANKHNVLKGNERLRMAESDLLLSQCMHPFVQTFSVKDFVQQHAHCIDRIGPGHYEEVQITTKSGHTKMHMAKSAGRQGRRPFSGTA